MNGIELANDWVLLEEVEVLVDTKLGKTPLSTSHYVGRPVVADFKQLAIVPSTACSTFINKKFFCLKSDIRAYANNIEEVKAIANS